jgi:hypothetical protein
LPVYFRLKYGRALPARPALHVCKAAPALYAYVTFFVRLFTFYGRATPDARERIPRHTPALQPLATSH